jgi:hypothetical protein
MVAKYFVRMIVAKASVGTGGFRFALIAAFAVASFFFVMPANAQLCAYNSTQGTCACPTTGGGTTCFGGQLYRSTDGSCQNDTRPCPSANQVFNCSTTACQCDTAAYPCGGCTAATSSPGGACSAPAGGEYTNQCGACACPSGKSLCAASNTCVLNIACAQGLTFNPCTNQCETPYVLLSPASAQTGEITVTGDITSSTGDLYLSSGKAIRVDGAGATTLNVGNWGGGTFSMCLNGTCRSTWPSTTDFNASYVNVTGNETMTGDLTLSGASTDLFVAGRVGIGTTTPTAKLQVNDGSVLFTGTTGAIPATGAGTRLMWYPAKSSLRAGAVTGTQWDDASIGNYSTAFGYNTTASGQYSISTGDSSTASGYGSAILGGRNSTATGDGGIAIGWYLGASGTNSITIGKGWTFASLMNNSTPDSLAIGFNSTEPTMLVTGADGFGTGHGEVGIGTSWDNLKLTNHKLTVKSDPNHGGIKIVAPSATWNALTVRDNTDSFPYFQIDSAGETYMTDIQYWSGAATTGTANGMVLTSDASGNASWAAPSGMGGSGTASYVPKFTAATTLGNSQIYDNGTNVGIGTTSPGSKFHVNGQGRFTAATGGDVLTVNNTGAGYGVVSNATSGFGLVGISASSYGIFGRTDGSSFGIYGSAPAGISGIFGVSDSGNGVMGQSTSGRGGSFVSTNNFGVYGTSSTSYGVYGFTAGTGYGVYGAGTSASSGVYGTSNGGAGVTGLGSTYGGIFSSSTGTGMSASTTSGSRAVSAQNSGSGYGVYATSASGTGVYGSGTNSFYGVGLLYNSSGAAFGGGTPNAAIGVNATGSTYGVYASSPYHAITAGGGAYGVYGSGDTYGVKGYSASTAMYAQGGAVGINAYGTTYGVYSYSPGGYSYYGAGGTIYNNGELYLDGWVRPQGNRGIYFQSYGGGWFMQDSTWIRSYGSKPVYMDNGFDTGNPAGIGCYGGLGAGWMLRVCGTFLSTGYIYGYDDIFLYDSAAWKYGGGSWLVFSDARSKENVHPFTDGLDVLEKIEPVNYTYNGLGQSPKGYEGIGVIAQDIEKVAPYTIAKRMGKLHPEDAEETELYSVDPSALTYVTINAIKELDATTVKKDDLWGEGSGWRSCAADGECACPEGQYLTKIRNAGTEIYCNKL